MKLSRPANPPDTGGIGGGGGGWRVAEHAEGAFTVVTAGSVVKDPEGTLLEV